MNDPLGFPPIDWEAWYRHSWHRNGETSEEKNQAEFWSVKASSFARKAHHQRAREKAEELLARFSWSSSERVLDVGAGPGTFAIPLAKSVSSVTAVDFSSEMLSELKKQADVEGVSNVKTLSGRWLDLPQDEVEGFDTVICFNALGVISMDGSGSCHMGRTLDRLRTSAVRGMVLVPHADLPVDRTMREALRLPEGGSRRERVAVLYHLMIRHGLLPSLEILRRPFFWSFADLDEGVRVLSQRLGLSDDPERLSLLNEHLKGRLERDGDGWLLEYPVAQALFWWEKGT